MSPYHVHSYTRVFKVGSFDAGTRRCDCILLVDSIPEPRILSVYYSRQMDACLSRLFNRRIRLPGELHTKKSLFIIILRLHFRFLAIQNKFSELKNLTMI